MIDQMEEEKKTGSEHKFSETNTAKPATAGEAPPTPAPHQTHDPPPTPSVRSRALLTLLRPVEASEQEWPRRMLEAVLSRYKQMPRFGWTRAYEVFVDKFGSSISEKDFIRRAKEALTLPSGRRCSTRRFRTDVNNRAKPLDVLFEENTLLEAKVFNSTNAIFKERLAILKQGNVEDAEWTPKVYSDSVDWRVMDALDRVVERHLGAHTPGDMTDIARILQAAQQTYKAATSRPKGPSTWRASIEAKIAKISASRKLLEQARARRHLKRDEERQAKWKMGELGLVFGKLRDFDAAVQRLTEAEVIYRRKLEASDARCEYRAANRNFELKRKYFYRSLEGDVKKEHSVPLDEIKGFWQGMWQADETETTEGAARPYEEYLLAFHPGDSAQRGFITFREFEQIVAWLDNWKAPGPDGVYNFFIKKLRSLHRVLYEMIFSVCVEGSVQASWFYTGRTSLLPKDGAPSGANFRPITCMSNIYKLTTKCVTRVMQEIVERRGLLADNQMGTVRFVEGAKEQVLVDKAICSAGLYELQVSWVDVCKAFDSIDHGYLRRCIDNLMLPEWISKMIGSLLDRWTIRLYDQRQFVLEKRLCKGILQGDSLSPLLFVICMDPLSRALSTRWPQCEAAATTGSHATNHLLFVDDLKIYARDEKTAKGMMEETRKFFTAVGLKMNKNKSATNSPSCSDQATLLDSTAGYKYLGVMQDKTSRLTKETFQKVRGDVLKRAESLCKTKLNGKNLVQALNEYALAKVNYYVGIIDLAPEEFAEIDHAVRQVLIKHHVHMQPGNKERLYLPRGELGRGLHNIEHRSECMMFQFRKKLEMQMHSSTRRGAILAAEVKGKTHMSLIEEYLRAKYMLTGDMSVETIKEAQRNTLYSEIQTRELHQKLYKVRENPMVSIEDSTIWLRKGNIAARDEASLCYLQDRNMFFSTDAKCPHCDRAKKSVDHLATRCPSLLTSSYTERHNEVVRILHLSLCNKYGIKKTKRLKGHSVQETVANEEAVIIVDTRIKTDLKLAHDRPDIVVHDKKRKEVLIVEVGITSQDRLQTMETEKWHKYDLLAKKLASDYKCSSRIVPFVMTWDGVVSKFHRNHIKPLDLRPNVEAYIQYIVLKKTLESISFEFRRGFDQEEEAVKEPTLQLRSGEETSVNNLSAAEVGGSN